LRKSSAADTEDHDDIHNAMEVLNASFTGFGGILKFNPPLTGAISHKPLQSAKVDILALAKNPVQDASRLFPNRFSACGRTMGYADPTFGGTFPDGNAAEIMADPDATQCGQLGPGRSKSKVKIKKQTHRRRRHG
jgi:hypothetical protein